MNINESRTDRMLRGGAAVVLVAVAAATGLTEPAGILMAVVAVVLLVTAATGFCPLYRLLGINTARGTQRVPSSQDPGRASR
jgi:hypothetical protein